MSLLGGAGGIFLPPAVLEIAANLTKFQAGMKQANQGLEDLGNTTTATGKRMSLGMKAAAATMAAALTGFLKMAVDEASEGEQAQSKLLATLQALGQNVDAVTPKVDAMGQAMVGLGFDDEDATLAFVRLDTALKDSTKSMGLMSLAADLARAKNTTLEGAARELAIASTGVGRGFREFGIQMDTSIKDPAQRGAKAMEELAKVIGTRAEAYTETFAGTLDVTRESVNNLVQGVGNALLPYMKQVANAFKVASVWASKHADVVRNVVLGALAAMAVALTAVAVANFLATWEIYLAIAALGALAAAFIYGWNNIDGFRNAVVLYLQVFGTYWMGTFRGVIGILQIFLNVLDKMLGAASAVASFMGQDETAKTFDEWGDALRGAANSMEGWDQALEDANKTLVSADFANSVKKLRFNFDWDSVVAEAQNAFAQLTPDTSGLSKATDAQTKKMKEQTKAAKEQAKAIREVAIAMNLLTDSYTRQQSYLAARSRLAAGAFESYVEVPVIVDGQVLFRVTQRAALRNNRRNATNGLAVSGSVI